VQRVRRSAGSHARCRVLFHLLARRPGDPSPCLRCGSSRDYYASGLCAGCYTQAIRRWAPAWTATPGRDPQHPLAVRACLAWRQQYPAAGTVWDLRPDRVPGPPRFVPAVPQTSWAAATITGRFDLAGANRHGHQLFFANMFYENGARTRAKDTAAAQPSRTVPAELSTKTVPATETDVFGEQLRLFTIRHDLAAAGRTGLHLRADPAQAAALESLARDLAAAASWRQEQLQDNIIGIRIVLVCNRVAGPQCAPAKSTASRTSTCPSGPCSKSWTPPPS